MSRPDTKGRWLWEAQRVSGKALWTSAAGDGAFVSVDDGSLGLFQELERGLQELLEVVIPQDRLDKWANFQIAALIARVDVPDVQDAGRVVSGSDL